jgi:preprotein translocase subunit SecA
VNTTALDLRQDWWKTEIPRIRPLAKGFDAFLARLGGRFRGGRRATARLLEAAARIASDGSCRELPDEVLQAALADVRLGFLRQSRTGLRDRERALALVREAAFRTLGFQPYPVQLAGALALWDRHIAEMATGEGKTATIAMAAVLRGWSARGCLVFTANDYLAERDAMIMRPLFAFCGVSVASVTGELAPAQRESAYRADIVYTTAKEALADFLRDRIAMGQDASFARRLVRSVLGETPSAGPRRTVQRGLHAAIVDEADNVLVDEAVTPLIISRQERNEPFLVLCRAAWEIASKLVEGKDYIREESMRTVRLVGDPCAGAAIPAGAGPFAGTHFLRDLVQQGLQAREYFLRDRQYVVDDGKVVIVDESTGRKMPMRSWSGGLHQMVEAKEGLDLSPVNETDARMSFQRFFRQFRLFSGMTGTGAEAAGEFWHVYGLSVVPIPSHRPGRRRVHPLRFFPTAKDKRKALLEEILRVHREGRPVLVGTRDVETSESIAADLFAAGVDCERVNALRQAEEAEVISRAGKAGAVTVATNMAGRGTDIKLDRIALSLGGLHVVASECHGSSRVDRQLFGRCARQGDPGSAVAFSSLEDELVIRHVHPILRAATSLMMRLGVPTSALGKLVVAVGQANAGRADAASRLAVQAADTWIETALSFSGTETR